MKKLSIIIPVYNEEETISFLSIRLLNALKKDFLHFDWEIIFIDDGSYDNTAAEIEKIIMQNTAYHLVQFSRNFGHHIAVSAGLDYATGDLVVIMDGDLQDQPEEVITLYKKLCTGYDVVYGWRKEKQFGYFKKVTSSFFIKAMKFLLNEKIEINTSIFRIMTKQVVDQVCRLQERQRYVLGLIGWVGFKHTFVDVKHGKREKGQTKYSFLKQLQLALNAIFSFSQFPLRFITGLGFLFTLCSFLLGCTGYTYTTLKTLLLSKFSINSLSYYNFFLFPLVAVMRKLNFQFSDQLAQPSSFLNSIFRSILVFERFLLPVVNLPIGVSLIAIAEKKK